MKVQSHRGYTEVSWLKMKDFSSLDLCNHCPTIFIIESNLSHIFDSCFPSLKTDSSCTVIPVESSEQVKSIDFAAELLTSILETFGTPRHIVTFGGGTLQDLSGFLAGLYRRGIKWTFIPSTLLSMADSCIGSKISINVGNNKNQIGFFYPPTDIYICTELLQSISRREYLSGCGDILHYALQDPAIDPVYINYLPKIFLEPDFHHLDLIIKSTLQIKQRFISSDEFDCGYRRLLNLGHTFGHAIESSSSFKIPHGIAVIIGCSLAFHASLKYFSNFNPSLVTDHLKLINELLLAANSFINNILIDPEVLLTALSNDKKNLSPDSLALVLPSISSSSDYSLIVTNFQLSDIHSFVLDFLDPSSSFCLDRLSLPLISYE